MAHLHYNGSTMYTLYILECADGSLYTGIAKDLTERLKAHEAGTGSKYVRTRLPIRVVYTEAHPDRSSASKREHEIKQYSKQQKQALFV